MVSRNRGWRRHRNAGSAWNDYLARVPTGILTLAEWAYRYRIGLDRCYDGGRVEFYLAPVGRLYRFDIVSAYPKSLTAFAVDSRALYADTDSV